MYWHSFCRNDEKEVVYPAVSWNHDGDLIMEAGGLDYNLTDGRDGVVRAIEDGYEKGADFMQSMWDVW